MCHALFLLLIHSVSFFSARRNFITLIVSVFRDHVTVKLRCIDRPVTRLTRVRLIDLFTFGFFGSFFNLKCNSPKNQVLNNSKGSDRL